MCACACVGAALCVHYTYTNIHANIHYRSSALPHAYGYSRRPLPHVIGSARFAGDDMAGLALPSASTPPAPADDVWESEDEDWGVQTRGSEVEHDDLAQGVAHLTTASAGAAGAGAGVVISEEERLQALLQDPLFSSSIPASQPPQAASEAQVVVGGGGWGGGVLARALRVLICIRIPVHMHIHTHAYMHARRGRHRRQEQRGGVPHSHRTLESLPGEKRKAMLLVEVFLPQSLVAAPRLSLRRTLV